jgi:ribose transport system substrate-binding protein
VARGGARGVVGVFGARRRRLSHAPAPDRGNRDETRPWILSTADAGLKFHLYDGGADVPEQVRGFNLAIAAKADAIMLGAGYPADAFAAQVAAAKKAGIPVFSINSHPLGPDAPRRVNGHTADVTYDYPGAGKLLADWFVADSGGKGHVLLIDVAGLPSSGWTLQGFKEEVKRLGAPVTISEASSSLGPSVHTDLANIARTAILRDPGINYIIPSFDDFALFVQTGLAQAGPAGAKVKTAGFNAVLTQVGNLKRDGTPLKADLGGPNQWFSYAVIDDVLRVLSGNPAVYDYKIGYKIFNHENARKLDVVKEVATDWYGVDYSALFKKVWSVKE